MAWRTGESEERKNGATKLQTGDCETNRIRAGKKE